jgi:hypothetical protein
MAAAPAADVLERDGVYAVRTGIASNAENGVVGGAAPASADAVRDVIAGFDERRLPAPASTSPSAMTGRSGWRPPSSARRSRC